MDEHPIMMMVNPRLDRPRTQTVPVGDVVLADFKDALRNLGFPCYQNIQRFLDIPDGWVSNHWESQIPIFGRNKVIYIKTYDVDITPPDHYIELLAQTHGLHI